MHSWVARISFAVAIVGSTPAAAAPPQDESTPATPGASAVDLGREGLAHYEERRFAEAYEAFDRADRLQHSPVFVLYKARSRRAMGRLLEAEALYSEVSKDRLGPDSPGPFLRAQGDARREMAELASNIPRLTVDPDPSLEDAEIAVGDRPYRGEALRLDPGSYRVTARRAGEIVAEADVELVLGQSASVALTPRPTTDVAPPAPDSADDGSWVLWGGITLGLGGASLIAGAVTGGLALDRAGDAQDTCGPTGICPDGDTSRKDEATTLAHASTATLIAGGALAVAGTVLLVVGTDDDGPELGLSPTSATLTLRF